MPASPEVARCRAQVAGLTYAVSAGRRTQDELVQAQDGLKAALVTQNAMRLLEKLPELTPEHLTRVTELLKSGIERVSKNGG